MWDDKWTWIKLVVIAVLLGGSLVYNMIKALLARPPGGAAPRQPRAGQPRSLRDFLDEVREQARRQQESPRQEETATRREAQPPHAVVIEGKPPPPPGEPVPESTHAYLERLNLGDGRAVEDKHLEPSMRLHTAAIADYDRDSATARRPQRLAALNIGLREALLAQVILGPPRCRRGRRSLDGPPWRR